MRLNQLLEPTFTSPDPRINIRQWNKNAEEYATRTCERESDGIRRAVYTKKIAPQDMGQHLIKDSDFNPSVVNNESLVDTAIGVGDSGTKKPSVGLNKST